MPTEGPAVKGAFERYLLSLGKTRQAEKTEHTDRAALETLLSTFAALASHRLHVQREPKQVRGKGAPDLFSPFPIRAINRAVLPVPWRDPNERRAMAALFRGHVNRYDIFPLAMTARLPLVSPMAASR